MMLKMKKLSRDSLNILSTPTQKGNILITNLHETGINYKDVNKMYDEKDEHSFGLHVTVYYKLYRL